MVRKEIFELSYLVTVPNAGSVPGTKEPTIFELPSATSSLFGEIEYPYLFAFCLAAAMLSRNPTTVIKL